VYDKEGYHTQDLYYNRSAELGSRAIMTNETKQLLTVSYPASDATLLLPSVVEDKQLSSANST
jgi:hypothetical protein